METGLLIVAITMLVVVIAYKHLTSRQLLGKQIPGPRGIPLLGSTFSVNVTKMHLSFNEWALRYGKVFKVSLFGKGIVLLNDVPLVKKAFVDDEYVSNFINHPKSVMGKYVFYNYADLAFSIRYDKRYVTLKKIFSKTLRKYSEENKSFEKSIHEELSRFRDNVHTFEGLDFEVKPHIRRSFVNLMSIMLSGDLPSERDAEMIWGFNDSAEYITEIKVVFLMELFPFLRHIQLFKVGRIFQRLLEQRDHLEKRYLISGKRRLNDNAGEYGIADMLLRLQKEENQNAGHELITEDNIKSLLFDIITGGMLSTTHAISAAIALLVDNPKCAQKIQTEIDDVIGPDRLPNIADKSKMDYMMAFIFETLRYISHGIVSLPREVSGNHKFEGYHMTKGEIVYSNIWYIHKDPALWEDPWCFIPERFLDVDGKLVSSTHTNRQNLVTFSVGHHRCPGSSFATGKIFLYVTSILQRFDILPPLSHAHKNLDPRNFKPGLFLEPEDFCLRMSART